jgi:hypothetical protein
VKKSSFWCSLIEMFLKERQSQCPVQSFGGVTVSGVVMFFLPFLRKPSPNKNELSAALDAL